MRVFNTLQLMRAFYRSLFCLFFIAANTVYAYDNLTPVEKIPDGLDFTLQDLDGKMHKLSDYKGKTVIINFWASWCPPCREEMPSMERAWQQIKNENIIMLAINVGEDEDTVFTFLGDFPVTFTILLDKSGEITESWPIRGLPTTYVISPQGKLVYRAIGGRNWDDKAILDTIRQLNK